MPRSSRRPRAARRQCRRRPCAPGRHQRLHGHGRRGRLRPFPRRHAAHRRRRRLAFALHDPGRTALAFVSLRADGEREFLFYRSPSADMLLDSRRRRRGGDPIGARFSFRLDQPRRRAATSGTLHAVELARRHGRMITYESNLRLSLWPDADAAREGMRLGLAHAEVVKISEEELVPERRAQSDLGRALSLARRYADHGGHPWGAPAATG